jgi:hypothetical protein
MTSKADKLRRKRGRPCKVDVARTASGRISRATATAPADAPDRLAKEVRMRKFNISKTDAALPESGSVCGRLFLSGQLSRPQYEALMRYSMSRERYMQALQAPDSLRTRRGGVMSVPTEDNDTSTIAAWDRIIKALSLEQRHHPGNLRAALNHIVTHDEDHPYMLGDLRVAANVLCRFYGLDGVRKVG